MERRKLFGEKLRNETSYELLPYFDGKQSYFLLLFNDHKLSIEDKTNTDIESYKAKVAEAQSKLKVLVDSNDGFEIAEADFRFRGPGDVFGVRQHGFDMYKFAQINEHTDLFAEARAVANKIKSGSLSINVNEQNALHLVKRLFTSNIEAELVEEKVKPVKATGTLVPVPSANKCSNVIFVVFDLETTGLMVKTNRIIQIAAKVVGEEESDIFNSYILPVDLKVSNNITELTGITQEFLNDNGMSIEEAIMKFQIWLTELKERDDREIILLAHNAKTFDLPFLKEAIRKTSSSPFFDSFRCVDSLLLLRDKRLWNGKQPPSFKLSDVHKFVMDEEFPAHNAINDVIALGNVLAKVDFKSIVDDYLFHFT
jgi:DNA polymerase III epsilon subunit-like protein